VVAPLSRIRDRRFMAMRVPGLYHTPGTARAWRGGRSRRRGKGPPDLRGSFGK
jgi:hypothetical protein